MWKTLGPDETDHILLDLITAQHTHSYVYQNYSVYAILMVGGLLEGAVPLRSTH